MTDIVLTDNELELVTELKSLRAERKDIEDREKELRTLLLQRLDGSPQAVTGSGAVCVKVKTQVRRNIDRPKLEALFPDVFESVVTESEVQIVELP